MYNFIITHSINANKRLSAFLTAVLMLTLSAFTANAQVSPTITTTSLPDGTTGTPYYAKFQATGTAPFKWYISGYLPPDLSLNEDTGEITGIPLEPGVFGIIVYATNSAGSDTRFFEIEIFAEQIISHPANRTIAVGSSTSFSVTVSGCYSTPYYQWEYRTEDSSEWLDLTDGGIYSGTKTSTLSLNNVPITYNEYRYRCVIISCFLEKYFYSKAATLRVTTGSIPPTITTTFLPSGTMRTPYSAKLEATGTAPITWSVSGLPGGLSLNTNTGEISGTPTDEAEYTLTVKATNSVGYDEQNYMLVIYPEPVMPEITSHPADSSIQEGNGTSFSVEATGCETASHYQWEYRVNSSSGWNSLTNGGVYSGATSATLSLTNVPITYNGYQYRCMVTFTCILDFPVYSDFATLTVIASGIPPVITTTSLPDGTVEITYSETLEATGTLPITWNLTSGALPGGLLLNASTGVISGTPTHEGTFIFTATATNTVGSDNRNFTIDISLTPIMPEIITHPADRTIPENTDTSFSVTTSGGGKISYLYQWQYRVDNSSAWNNVTNGSIYSTATTATLALSNVPITYNGYQYRCRVIAPDWDYWTDYSNAATLTVTTAGIPPIITTISLPDGIKGATYSTTLTATGTAPITWSIASGSLPDVLSLNANTGVISGTPTTTATYTFTVRASNGINPDDTKEFTIIIKDPQLHDVIEITPPTEPFCTADDYILIPFKKIDEGYLMKYSVIFSEEAKAAGFKDKTSFENLPLDMLFKIEIPEGAPTKSYSGNIKIECEGIDSFIDEYPFSFFVINNGVVIINQPPSFQSLCNGASIALVVDISGNANGYQWYKNGKAIAGANNKEYEAVAEGNYYVEIVGECGTIRSDVAVLAPPSPSPAGISVRVKWGNLLYVENASNKYQRYQWYHNGVAINGATFVYFSEKEGFLGEYFVRCYKPDGNFDETCPVVFNTRSTSSFSMVYPTVLKANDLLNINIIDANYQSEATVEIYSLLGVLVYSTKINAPFATIKLEIQHKGNYFVKILMSSGEVFNEKIIVQ